MNNSPRFWSWVFRSKGVWNCAATLSLAMGERHLRALLGDTAPFDPLYQQLFMALAFVFGVFYWRTGRAPEQHKDVIWMGIAGQVSVFVLAVLHFRPAPMGWIQLGSGVVDLVYAILFAMFLMQSRQSAKLKTP